MFPRPEYPPAVQLLVEAGHHSPSADNSQPWRFQWDGIVLTVTYDSERVRGRTFGPDEHATLITMGAVRENLLQMAGWLGLDPTLLPPETGSKLSSYARVKLEYPEKMSANAEQHSLFRRHTNRLSYAPSPIAADIIEALGTMRQGNCTVLTLTDPERIHTIARWVHIASEVRFQTEELHEFLGRSLRFSETEANHGDGLDVRTLNLPIGGKAFLRLIKNWPTLNFLNRFRFYRALAAIEARPVLSSMTVIGVVGPSTNKMNDLLDAGALMERVWIYLNSRQIAVQPFYVVTDQIERLKSRKVPGLHSSQIENLQAEVRKFFNSAETTIHMLLRAGYPRKVPIRSMRLPVETVSE